MRRRLQLPLASQLVLVQLILIGAVLLAVSAVSVEITRLGFVADQGRRVLTLAENLAASPVVRSEDVDRAGAVLPATVTTQQALTGVDVAMIADRSGRVVASTDALLVGDVIPWPQMLAAPQRAHQGSVEVRGTAYLIGAAPILSDPPPGNPVRQLGVALVAQRSPSRLDSLVAATPTLLTYLGAALLLGVGGSLLLARWIKRGTLGMEPAEIAALAEQREAIFAGIAEGVLALDIRHRITVANAPAIALLSLPADPVGADLDDLAITGRLRDVLTGVETERDAVVLRSGRVLVLNHKPVVQNGRLLGSVTTLRDRTPLAELERELGSFRGTTDLLRAQAHEFANQLHTISGLVQIGDYDDVVTYVHTLVASRAAVDLTIAQRVRDASVAALLVAKSAQAAERRVDMRVGAGTALETLEPQSSFDVATVTGNLIQNGVDAVTSALPVATATHTDSTVGWVEVDIHQTGDVVEIVVRDSGPGVAATIASEVFEHGFTTKAARDGERGIGLALIRRICRTRGGDVEVRATDSGAAFAAWMTVEPAPTTTLPPRQPLVAATEEGR